MPGELVDNPTVGQINLIDLSYSVIERIIVHIANSDSDRGSHTRP